MDDSPSTAQHRHEPKSNAVPTEAKVPDMLLQPLALKHAPCMLRWMKDPTIAANIGLRRQPSLEATRKWITRAREDPNCTAWAIYGGRRYIGNLVLDQYDRLLGSVRLSIYVGEITARGRGWGAAAIRQAAHYAFAKADLNKIWLTVHEHNLPALRAYFRLGFALEGVLREEFILEGQRVNAWRLSLLRREYVALNPTSVPSP